MDVHCIWSSCLTRPPTASISCSSDMEATDTPVSLKECGVAPPGANNETPLKANGGKK